MVNLLLLVDDSWPDFDCWPKINAIDKWPSEASNLCSKIESHFQGLKYFTHAWCNCS